MLRKEGRSQIFERSAIRLVETARDRAVDYRVARAKSAINVIGLAILFEKARTIHTKPASI